ncbi:hypothetical protein phiTE_071 [Pectobacterium phage phiTE]|uniref:Uncharacterized protein n=1 Tax=Pectobacterium phage phiTE TaxID=1116482 RepID=K9L5K5_9CAUD|nr:hypothetical protein phiTE_071 [Pectobacterium phage phiTE]AEZ66237.1 hypothetical protein phiTE_071 [Pectobacterium phage phiTE]
MALGVVNVKLIRFFVRHNLPLNIGRTKYLLRGHKVLK